MMNRKKLKRGLASVVVATSVLVLFACQKGGGADPGGTISRGDTTSNGSAPPPAKLNYVFGSSTEGYSCFRIPAIMKTDKGTLLAFAEARKNNCGDAGNIDLVVRRSTDNGKTWSSLITVWDDGGNTCGNPVPIMDTRTGKVVLVMSWNLGSDNLTSIGNGTSQDTRRAYVTTSSDDGLSWEKPREITDSVKKSNWGWFASGPCHGIQLSGGSHDGRLIVPCDYIEVLTKKGSSYAIYSDDDGDSWHLGGIVSGGGNECAVARLSSGELMLNMRSSGGYRLVSTSADDGMSWTKATASYYLPGPKCQGSLLSYVSGGKTWVYFSNPANRNGRTNMTIKRSADDGGSWPDVHQVYSGPSAYSDLVMIDADHVGILYEAGLSSPYEGIAFESIAVNDL